MIESMRRMIYLSTLVDYVDSDIIVICCGDVYFVIIFVIVDLGGVNNDRIDG